MARKLRVEYPGAIYHLMNRGDRREHLFKDDEDRQRFLGTLGEACVKTGWQVHAYCLMSNHFHLVIEMPQANLRKGVGQKRCRSMVLTYFCWRRRMRHGSQVTSG